ncbi:uncharacterized protein LOC108192248 isoform X1 [Daucus carota subsp. sativus]|uniref:uncharacterized protein LOC108192248 isoform X1 n=1 Tax=Daucus carota subsp. sativus TaxID=79200 RepID=UPI0007E057F9|nr:PREDICTED: uncharacterized protein LOC108192248 isoform X1 [Daucus carota subsp. sativus]
MAEEVEMVCPTEDMFSELLDSLVAPYLPTDPAPSLHQHQLIANQMHAVVVLYNYYHRKRHPSLEYLSFTSCCKLAVIFKPKLLAYMKLMCRPDYHTVVDLKGQLSLTEEAIMGACKVSSALLAHEDVPGIGWPIRKVTVLLVDSTRENCLLLFGSITKGIWSAIERDLKSTSEIGKCSGLRPRTEVHTDEDALLQLAFSGINEVAGINNSDLEVLERHTVYSLNVEKTAAHFFIVQSSQSITADHQCHIKDVIESLQGPLVRKSSRGWMLTTVHQYFHLLPYTRILADWFSREQLSKQVRVNVKDTITQCSNSTKNHLKTEVVGKNISHENICVTDAEATDGSHDTAKQEINGCTHHISLPEKVDGDEINKDASSNVKVNHPVKETDAMEIDKDVLPSDEVLVENDNECFNSIDQDKVDVDAIGSFKINHPSMKIDSVEIDNYISPNNINPAVQKSNSVMGITSKQFKVVESLNSRISSNSGDSVASYDRAVDSHQPKSINVEKPTSNLASDEDALQQALRKREKLSMQRSSIQEELALCEKQIQTFIDGDAYDMGVKMQAVKDFCNYVSTKSTTDSQVIPGPGPCQHLEDPITQHAKRKRSSVDILPVEHFCQELDIFCCMNYWMLPTYSVRSSEEGYYADVNVKGAEFSSSEVSNLKTTPAEARASAAAKMMAVLDHVLPKQ